MGGEEKLQKEKFLADLGGQIGHEKGLFPL